MRVSLKIEYQYISFDVNYRNVYLNAVCTCILFLAYLRHKNLFLLQNKPIDIIEKYM